MKLGDRLQRTWREIIEQKDPQKASALKADGEDLEWAEHAVSTTASYGRDFLPGRRDLWTAVREVPAGRELYRFEQHEIDSAEHFIAAASKAAAAGASK
jgi:hypothetical protein